MNIPVLTILYGGSLLHHVPHELSDRAIKINLAGDGKQAVDNVLEDAQTTKFIENGQVFIRKGNKTFNVLGAQVK